MSDSPAMDVARYLDVQGVGDADPGGNIITGAMPNNPDTILVIRDTPGYQSNYTMGSNVPCMEYPAVQISARAPTFAAAQTLVWAAYRALATSPASMNGRRYLAVSPMQTPFMLPRDATSADGRAIFAFNVDLIREYV